MVTFSCYFSTCRFLVKDVNRRKPLVCIALAWQRSILMANQRGFVYDEYTLFFSREIVMKNMILALLLIAFTNASSIIDDLHEACQYKLLKDRMHTIDEMVSSKKFEDKLPILYEDNNAIKKIRGMLYQILFHANDLDLKEIKKQINKTIAVFEEFCDAREEYRKAEIKLLRKIKAISEKKIQVDRTVDGHIKDLQTFMKERYFRMNKYGKILSEM